MADEKSIIDRFFKDLQRKREKLIEDWKGEDQVISKYLSGSYEALCGKLKKVKGTSTHFDGYAEQLCCEILRIYVEKILKTGRKFELKERTRDVGVFELKRGDETLRFLHDIQLGYVIPSLGRKRLDFVLYGEKKTKKPRWMFAIEMATTPSSGAKVVNDMNRLKGFADHNEVKNSKPLLLFLAFKATFKRPKTKVIKDIEGLLETCDNLYITILDEDGADKLKGSFSSENLKKKVVTFEEFLKKVDRELNVRNRTIKR